MKKNSLIEISDDLLTWENAIKKGVKLLVDNDIATNELADKIIQSTKQLGPYYVLMPKLALAHTSPGPYNKKIGLSLVLFKKAIKFSDNDRHDVNLLFTLSAIDSNSHIDVLTKFANIFSNESIVEKAIKAKNVEELFELFKDIIKL